jgi:hypothetical protein
MKEAENPWPTPEAGAETPAPRKAWVPPVVEVTLAPSEIRVGSTGVGPESGLYS